MPRTARLGFPFLIVALIAADPPKESAQSDFDNLQGEWQRVSLQHGKHKYTEEEAKAIRYKINGDKLTLVNEGREVKTISTIKLDATKSPKTYDESFKDFKGDLVVTKGIYKLEGDTLTKWNRDPTVPSERPTEYKEAEGVWIATYKRVGK